MNRRCALPYADPDYQRPTVDEIRDLIRITGWSQSDVARLVGVNFNPKKGSTTVRKWKAPDSSPDHRTIPYSAWRLMLIEAGVVSTVSNRVEDE